MRATESKGQTEKRYKLVNTSNGFVIVDMEDSNQTDGCTIYCPKNGVYHQIEERYKLPCNIVVAASYSVEATGKLPLIVNEPSELLEMCPTERFVEIQDSISYDTQSTEYTIRIVKYL